MVKQIVRDQFFLQQKSEPATKADKQVVEISKSGLWRPLAWEKIYLK